MTAALSTLCWPVSRVGDALEALAHKVDLISRPLRLPAPDEEICLQNDAALGEWIDTAVSWLALEANHVEVSYGDAETLLQTAGVALLRVNVEGERRFLALLGKRGRKISILSPDLKATLIKREELRASLSRDLEVPLEAEVTRLLNSVGLSRRRCADARKALLRDRLTRVRLGDCWILRLPPCGSFWRLAYELKLPHRFGLVIGLHAFQYLLWILSWWLVGRAALGGRLDLGWLLAWALLLLTIIPLRLLETWSVGTLSIGGAGLLKQCLLYGALRLEPEEIRHHGIGQHLGSVLEAEAVESLALNGGLLGFFALIELVMAAAVLAIGAGGALQALSLFAWITIAIFIATCYYRCRERWTEARLEMTHDLIERMVGHRTRLAQEAPDHWHDGEEQSLEHYLQLSNRMDKAAALLIAFMPRGWLILGIVGIARAFVSGTASAATLAVSLGGIMLAFRAFEKLASGLWHLAGAAIAWKKVAPLYHAAQRPWINGSPALVSSHLLRRRRVGGVQTALEAHELSFGYRDRPEPVLRKCSVKVRAGDRILLEGPSGSGKSTLASLLVGLRIPESGLLLLDGFDRQTLGFDSWRRRVVAAPQFHENHVLTETFAFNLLMGRRWPAQEEDFKEAEAICRELGLGELLSRMPAGLLQMVGESGWQLSHGERSRLYIARALLQRADVIILDESFAALDPENLRRAVQCVMQYASTLLVIAHR